MYYCDTCDKSMCLDCAILTHEDHDYNLIADGCSFTKHREALENSLNPVKGKIEAIKKALCTLAERGGKIRERVERVLEEIQEMMTNVFRQSERKLTEQARRVTDAKLKMLSEQMKSAEKYLSLLEDVEDYVEQESEDRQSSKNCDIQETYS